ncbi:MAG: glycosyltransferase family 4 protein, partial [Planctomycetota bacterium]
MHILFLSDSFPPDGNERAARLYEHARRWVAAGHRVRVVVRAPHAADGPVAKSRESVAGIDVVRIRFRRKAGLFGSLAEFGSAVLAGLRGGRADAVVAALPRRSFAFAGWLVASLRRRPFVLELNELTFAPTASIDGERRRARRGVSERLEAFLVRKATTIVAVTYAFKEELIGRGVAAEKVAVVTNGVDLATYVPSAGDGMLLEQLGLEGRFVVGFVGQHGTQYALDKVLDAAARLQGRSAVHFLFVGEGATRASLIQRQRELDLHNVTFYGGLPEERLPAIWSLCDVALVHVRDARVFETVIPPMLFEAMGMGLPVVAACPAGETTRIVRSTDCGIVVPPEEPRLLADSLDRLARDAETMARLARHCAQAAPRYGRDLLAREMLGRVAAAAGIELRTG